MMRSTRVLVAVGAATLLTTVAACGSSGSSGASAPAASSGTTTSASAGGSSAAAKEAALSVANTSLGSIVVGSGGRTVYMFAKDTKGSGKSSCTGPCLTNWPPVIVSGTPKASGISGKVGTITTADGKKQLTLGGWPLYYFAGDKAAGDVAGQGINGFGGLWWALTGDGSEVTSSTSGGSSTGSGGGGQGGGYGY